MKHITKFNNGILTPNCAQWFSRTGLIETLWILDNIQYIWCQKHGLPGTYKQIVIKKEKQ